MLAPIKPVDFELTTQSVEDVRVPDAYAAARVLVRWHGLPVGSIQVPVAEGRVAPREFAAALSKELSRTLGSEFVRRALWHGRPSSRFDILSATPPQAGALPPVSLVICTRDRPADLALCLAAVARLQPAPDEVIVVDNAPRTEATAELVRQQYPQLRYIREDTPGLDHARNRGIREARGEIIAFTDDDVVVDPGWIGALGRAFAADPAIGLITGLIEPYELETEAQVLFERYGGFGRGYRRQYLQAAPGARLSWSLIGAGQLGAGANMAVRRERFEQIGLFDPALDVGTPTRGGGDHEIFYRLIKSGCLCLYEPAALVRHRHRRTFEELSRLLYDYGHATRCYFERVVQNFPEDAAGVKQLTRWWWRHWAWQRWWQAHLRASWFPPELVSVEIKGFREGRGGYARARRQIVADEAARPDAFNVAAGLPAGLTGLGVTQVDLAQPLRELTEGASHRELEVIVRREGQLVGSVRILSLGKPVSIARLVDEISRNFWAPLLRSVPGDEATAWAVVSTRLADHLHPPPTEASLPSHYSASIIVATCDRPDDLRRCLHSLARLDTERRLQTIVVDNRPSSGRTADVLREFPDVELVAEARAGSSYARNAGIAAAWGDFIVMTDDDMVVAPDWLEQLLKPFARHDVMAVTGNTLAGRVETAAERYFETYGGFGRGFVRQEYTGEWFQHYRRRAVPTWRIGGTGNSAYRAELFRRADIGVFDERLGSGVPTGVGEDTKLFYDILHAGYTIIYEPGAIAWHYHRVTMPALRRQLYGYSKGHVAYHLVTWLQYRDKRALSRIALELPKDLLWRTVQRLRGRYPYPWRLLLTEMAGTAAGPWSLWQAHRLAQRVGPGARPSAAPSPPASVRSTQPALEGAP